MPKYESNFRESVHGSAFGDNAQVYNYYGDDKEKFVEITLEELESQFKGSPEIKLDLVNILAKKKLLVLGGDLGVNKNELALQIAFLLAQQIGDLNRNVSIRQWRRSSNQQLTDIDLELKNVESPTVFILTGVEPQNISSNRLQQIYETQNQHYVLISTEISFSRWHLGESARQFFPELKIEDIYDNSILLKQLEEQIKKNNLEQEIAVYFDGDNQLLELSKKLNKPRNIIRFVELFRKEIERHGQEETLKSIEIETLIRIAKDDEQFIRELYYEILNPGEQLLALGLSFFNGLFEDQLFAALERVVQEVWQKRDPSLRALDYCDLDKLQDYYFELSPNDLYESASPNFKVVETKDYKIDIRSIKIISLENRRMLFKIAWESHRRQIVTALDVLVDLVKESVVEENYYHQGKWELYGDRTRREKLRSLIGETLSEIGLVSISALSAVQGSLLRLATDPDFNVRSVAASAIARWYDSADRHEQELFRTLQCFYGIALEKEAGAKAEERRDAEQSDETKTDKPQNYIAVIATSVVNTIRNLFGTTKVNKEFPKQKYDIEGESLEDSDYVGATVAVTIGDIIYNYFETGDPSNKFYSWLKELSESRLRFVQFYFGYHTLFWIVPLHFHESRIQEILKEMAQRYTEIWKTNRKFGYFGYFDYHFEYCLNHAIARSLAHTYRYQEHHDNVCQILGEWYDECYQRRWNDGLLKTVVLTYGLIEYSQDDKLTVDQAFTRLANVLNNKPSYLVRDAVVFSIYSLTFRYFDLIEDQLQDLAENFTLNEREDLIEILTKIYLKQRTNLSGGDDEIIVNKRHYRIWINLERPLTVIEEAMYRWIRIEGETFQKSNKKVAQKVALSAFTAFAANLDQEEERHIQELKGGLNHAES